MSFQLRHLFLLTLAFLFISSDLESRHLIGGDATYEFIGYNADSTEVTYLVSFTLYRDSSDPSGAELFNSEDFGLYRLEQGEWIFVRDYDADRGIISRIAPIDEPCREEPPPSEVGVESAIYQFTMTVDVIDSDYMVTYQRCCRNSTIGNMAAFEEGAVLDLLISRESLNNGNSSPTFDSFPPIFICANFPMDVPLACSDMEADSLVYSFCTPIASGGNNGGTGCNARDPSPRRCPPPYDELEYIMPFSETSPMAGNPIVSINPVTGLISGVPELIGQFVVGICVEEYRDGILLSRLRRDFQFNVLPCIKELSANLVADEVVIDNSMGISRPINVIKACGDSLVLFEGQDVNNTIVDYSWVVKGPTGTTFLDTAGRNVRTVELYLPELGQYEGTLIVQDREGCIDTAFLNVLRLPDLESNFEFDIPDTCYLGPTVFTDLSVAEASEVVDWNWNFSSEEISTDQNPEYQFNTRGVKKVTLITTDLNTCIDTFVEFINYDPPHDSLLFATLPVDLCFGDSVFFDGDWIKEAGVYNQLDVSILSGCDSLYTTLNLSYFDQPTETKVDTVLCPGETFEYFGIVYGPSQLQQSESNDFLHTTKSINSSCDSILHYLTYEYDELPVVNKESEELIYLIADRSVRIPISISGSYNQVLWTPELGLNCIDCPYPEVNSDVDTTYIVTLTTGDDCVVVDSITIDFKVVPEDYYIPTAISQSAVDKNNRHLFLMTQENALGSVTYDLKVYDRWGGLRYESFDLKINDRNEGWTPENLIPGVYTYVIDIHEFFESKKVVGSVTIIE